MRYSLIYSSVCEGDAGEQLTMDGGQSWREGGVGLSAYSSKHHRWRDAHNPFPANLRRDVAGERLS